LRPSYPGWHAADVASGEAEHRDIIPRRHPHHLEADIGVHHGDAFVARAIPLEASPALGHRTGLTQAVTSALQF
jgi:hypothetical protein